MIKNSWQTKTRKTFHILLKNIQKPTDISKKLCGIIFYVEKSKRLDLITYVDIMYMTTA